ncbi:serine/threonine-protein kinase [Catenuloplanes sp. NPDC051500]|uniref:serine/threonine-protein kinase n=1 Tax=Catenuloplanes sp. NPDC051500 TaxID=3363959 RepID=UPI003798C7D8
MSGLRLVDRRYELRKRPLSQEGMGEVWLGHDNRLNREVVVKFLRVPSGDDDEEHIRRRFERESTIIACLEHPGVPAIYDVGYDGETPYMVMQRIHGLTIADLVAAQHLGTLPIGWVAAIGAQICSVLAAAHGAGLVHRDLQPRNVMLEPYGSVKVLDFGFAVAPSAADISRITQMGVLLGTPACMTPEQMQSNECGPAIDLYALGCTLYEMLTGTPLFSGATPFALMIQQVNAPPPAPRSQRPEVPAELDQLVLSLLEKKPEDRPASAEEAYRQLLPLSVDLGPLPGALDLPSMSSPARMYAGVLHRVFAKTTEREQPAAAYPGEAQENPRRANADTRVLIQHNHPAEAADVLARAELPARRSVDNVNAETMSARYELAGLLFEAADYADAEPIFQVLGEMLPGEATMSEVEFNCRYKAAICAALTDRRRVALERLESLFADYLVTHGDTDNRALRLRRQIGQLQLDTGEHKAARQTFTALLAVAQSPLNNVRLDADEIIEMLASIPAVQNSQPTDPGWQDVLRYADLSDPVLDNLVAALSGRGIAAPLIGYELGNEGWLAELAWPIYKTAIMVLGSLNEQELIDRDTAYDIAGWDARPAARWNADEICRRVTT